MRRLAGGIALALAALLVVPAVADAEFGIAPGSATTSILDSAGNPEARAGAHPDRLETSFGFDLKDDGTVDGNVKEIAIDLPPGMVGNPRAVAQCSREQFSIGGFDPVECPAQAQVGVALLRLAGLGELPVPIYNVEPGPGNLAELGYRLLASGRMAARLGPDGQTLSLVMSDVVQDFPLEAVSLELWGVPADHQDEAGARRPFLTNPTRCTGPGAVTLRARSWQEPAVWRTASASVPPLFGCGDLHLSPQLGFALDSPAADTPTGARFDVAIPQSEDPDGRATARVEALELSLPEGVVLSPGVANRLEACGDEAAAVGASRASTCPAASRLGSVELSSPVVAGPLSGALYLGRRLGETENRIFVVADVPGAQLKVAGSLTADPRTGRLAARLAGLPDLPLDHIALRFRGGARAPLVAPPTCGSNTAVATFTPSGGAAAATASASVVVGSGPGGTRCLAMPPFAPTFVAGTSPARAGASSAFSLTIRRRDGEQSIDRFQALLPPGVAARLTAVRRCAAPAAGACSPASRIGSALVEVGAGPSPLALAGDVFLTGPHRGAPLGVALVFRAIAGPFDLGTIVIRAKLGIAADSGRLSIDSDALPQIVGGFPLRLQTVALDVDRPRFIVNPTSCRRSSASSAIRSTTGVVARSKVRFAVVGCRRLRVRSRLSVALTDRAELRRGGRPGLGLGIVTKSGGSNVRAAELRLPKLLALAPPPVTAICSRQQAADGRCPSGSRVGGARVRSPILAGTLRGAVYVAQPRGGGLPELLARVERGGIALNVHMEVAVEGGRTVVELTDVPDLPLSSFAIRIPGGARGLFVTRRDLCARARARRMAVTGSLTGHSGASRALRAPVRASCRVATRSRSDLG
jgi:hypothetical protein